MTQVLLTRSWDDGERTVAGFEKIGIQACNIPLQEATFLPLPIRESDYDTLIFTSKNGVRSFAREYTSRNYLVLCVGDSTASCAKAMGFYDIISASGNVENLVSMIREMNSMPEARCLYVSGLKSKSDIAELLPEYHIKQVIGYETQENLKLSPVDLLTIADSNISHVVLFSPQSARNFARTLEKYALEDTCYYRNCVGFSDAVLEPIKNLGWKKVTAIPHPSMKTLMEHFKNVGKKETY